MKEVLREMVGVLTILLPGFLMVRPELGVWVSWVMAVMVVAIVAIEISSTPTRPAVERPPPRRSARLRARSRDRAKI